MCVSKLYACIHGACGGQKSVLGTRLGSCVGGARLLTDEPSPVPALFSEIGSHEVLGAHLLG